MKINIEAPFPVKEELQSLVEEKIGKLKIIFERITSVEIYLKEEEKRHQTANGKIVEIRINVPQQTLFAAQKSEQFEKALAGATEKMRKQLRKYKQNLNGH